MKVKCNFVGSGLTQGVIYDVIDYIPSNTNKLFDYIIILDDNNTKSTWYYSSFDDVTAEYRNNIINGILV